MNHPWHRDPELLAMLNRVTEAWHVMKKAQNKVARCTRAVSAGEVAPNAAMARRATGLYEARRAAVSTQAAVNRATETLWVCGVSLRRAAELRARRARRRGDLLAVLLVLLAAACAGLL